MNWSIGRQGTAQDIADSRSAAKSVGSDGQQVDGVPQTHKDAIAAALACFDTSGKVVDLVAYGSDTELHISVKISNAQ